jgi:outer membrane lipoprotein SlyB
MKQNVIVAIAVSTALTVFAGVANAQTNVRGVTNEVYKTVIKQVPYSVEVCREVTTSGDKTGDALKGAIIGGVIGNNVTKNIEGGGTIGAIIGGMIGHQNSDAVGGTTTQCKVETRYKEQTTQVYSHSTITFWDNGREYTVRFNK